MALASQMPPPLTTGLMSHARLPHVARGPCGSILMDFCLFVYFLPFVFGICYSDYIFNHHIAFTVERLSNLVIHYFILILALQYLCLN